jgi:hypothetical protein
MGYKERSDEVDIFINFVDSFINFVDIFINFVDIFINFVDIFSNFVDIFSHYVDILTVGISDVDIGTYLGSLRRSSQTVFASTRRPNVKEATLLNSQKVPIISFFSKSNFWAKSDHTRTSFFIR